MNINLLLHKNELFLLTQMLRLRRPRNEQRTGTASATESKAKLSAKWKQSQSVSKWKQLLDRSSCLYYWLVINDKWIIESCLGFL